MGGAGEGMAASSAVPGDETKRGGGGGSRPGGLRRGRRLRRGGGEREGRGDPVFKEEGWPWEAWGRGKAAAGAARTPAGVLFGDGDDGGARSWALAWLRLGRPSSREKFFFIKHFSDKEK